VTAETADMAAARRLSALALRAEGGADPAVSALAVESRAVCPGALFAALGGSRRHGAEFVADALARGAVAVLTDAEGAERAGAAVRAAGAALVLAADPRAALAGAAALFFGARPETMVAVTGTNGKTSVASFTRQIWEAEGRCAASLGTLGVEGAVSLPLAHTTPEPVTLHAHLARLAAAGVTHAAMEASSHGLDQRRLDGVRLAAAGFTNITRDHLDYHADFESYLDAKAGLFTRVLGAGETAVINVAAAGGAGMAARARAAGRAVLTVGGQDADLALLACQRDLTGQRLRVAYAGAAHEVCLELVGDFQAGNALVAAGLAIAAGSPPEAALGALARLVPVPGRMQRAAVRANGAAVFVDYAHTPDALATALAALRPHVMGRIAVVFGAGGARDRGKRPLMADAAARHADVVIVTDDNPRDEDPAAIRAEILQGCPEALEIGDRAEAILRGVAALGPGDALLIAGKGHETGQVIGTETYPFNDVEQASIAVAALDGRGA